MKEVQIDGQDVCIANVGGKYYAIGNVCTHEGGPLLMVYWRVTRLNVLGINLNLM